MKSERRKRYPKDWEVQAFLCKEGARWQCASCQVSHLAQRVSRRTGQVYTIYLHAAHRDHDLGNPRPRLLCLCPACHGTYDAIYRTRQKIVSLERLKHTVLLARRGYRRKAVSYSHV